MASRMMHLAVAKKLLEEFPVQDVIFFFTEEMADAFIELAVNVCRKEMKAIRSGGVLLDEMEYTWSSEMIVQSG